MAGRRQWYWRILVPLPDVQALRLKTAAPLLVVMVLNSRAARGLASLRPFCRREFLLSLYPQKVNDVDAQIKSKQRVADHGEVFTSEREVNAMLDLVKQQTERIESRFLEPACGTGNFLIEVLRRKLDVVESRYKKNKPEYERYAVLAVSSIYGVDILQDNVFQCRARLFQYFDDRYHNLYAKEISEDCRQSVKFILDKNILWGDALTMKSADGQETPIVFAEWSAINGTMIKRRDYSFAHLLAYQPMDGINLFSDLGEEAFIAKPIKDYPLMHFLRLEDVEG